MYAWPERRRYPLNTRRQVHAAIAHFAANRWRYPVTLQLQIAHAIKAKAGELGINVVAF